LDKYVGDMVNELKDEGLFDRTSIILTSDHGHSDVKEHFDLDGFLDRKLKTLYAPSKFKEWLSAEAINMVSGNSMSNIYVRKNGWNDFSFVEDLEKHGLVEELLNQKAVDVIAMRSENRGVAVLTKNGKAYISQDEDGKIKYEIDGSDPFGLKDVPSDLTEKSAIEKTWNSNYPDAIVQTVQLFRSPRAGDIVVSAAPGYDLRSHSEEPPHNSTHGSLRDEHMLVPLCINSKIDAEFIRTVDTLPTVLNLLGIYPSHKMDGKSLI